MLDILRLRIHLYIQEQLLCLITFPLFLSIGLGFVSDKGNDNKNPNQFHKNNYSQVIHTYLHFFLGLSMVLRE